MITPCCLGLPGIIYFSASFDIYLRCISFIRWFPCIRHSIIFLGISARDGTCTITCNWKRFNKTVRPSAQVKMKTASKASQP